MTGARHLERHPWNTAFEWTDHEGPFRRLTPAQVDQFDELGYVVLDEVFTDEELAPVIAATDALEATTDQLLADRDGGRFSIAERGAITFSLFPVLTDDAARRFAAHPVFTDLCHDLVGPNVRLYHDQAVYKKPEKPRRFPWHQDNGYNFVEPQQYLTCWVALTDATTRERVPATRAAAPSTGNAAAPFRRSTRVGDLRRSSRRDRRSRRGRWCRGLLLAVASPHRTEHDGIGTQGLHPPVRARRCMRVAWRDNGPADRGEPANDADRQFPILVDGQPVATWR